jgi:hypothetical protein
MQALYHLSCAPALDKDFRSIVLNMFIELKETMDKQLN